MSDIETITPAAPPVPSWAQSDPYPSLLEVVRHRRSVRKFEPGRRVPRETLIKIMEAGRWAPSGVNAQHWDFICVDDDETRTRVREVFLRQGARLRQSVERFPAVNKSFLATTVAIILVLGDERFKACFPQGSVMPPTSTPAYPARYPESKWRRLEQMVHWNGFSADQYRPQELVEHYVHDVRSFAMYRPFEHIEEWDDVEERAGAFKAAYTGRVTNPAGALPNPSPTG